MYAGAFKAPGRGVPLEFCTSAWRLVYRAEKGDIFSRLETIHERSRRRDRRTETGGRPTECEDRDFA